MWSAPTRSAPAATHPMIRSTESGRSSVYQNGSTTTSRASGSSSFEALQVGVDRGLDVVRGGGHREVVVQPHRHDHDVGRRVVLDDPVDEVVAESAVVHEAEPVDAGIELVPAALLG